MEQVLAVKRLRAKEVPALGPGTHKDGGGLRLVVEPPKEIKTPGARCWVLRVTIGGNHHNHGLGPYPLVSLHAEFGDHLERLADRREGAVSRVLAGEATVGTLAPAAGRREA